jgi:hypothetical protein
MVLNEFLRKYSDYSNFEIEFQQNQDISDFDLGKAIDEYYFPEALQNFADRICAEQRKFCAKKVFQNHLHGQSTFEGEMIAMKQPEIEEL